MSQLLSNELLPGMGSELSVDPENGTESLKIEMMPSAEGLFNVSTWETEENQASEGTTRHERTVHLLGRGAITMSGFGLPDVTPLIHRQVGSDGRVKSSETVYETPDGNDSLEDPRVLRLADGRLFIGLTAVTKMGNDWIPHPAIAVTSNEQLANGLREHKIITNLGMGAQTTPIGENINGKNTTYISETTVMFRPEGPESNHRLRVFGFKDGQASLQQDDIELPDNIPWATFRTGTTMPPVWLNNREAIFPIHGISIDQNGKDVYSIGAARLVRSEDGTLSIDNISQEPLIHPDLFNDLVGAEEVELHPEEKDSVYCVSGGPVFDSSGNIQAVELTVSRGDMHTFKVTASRAMLTKGWPSSEQVTAEQTLPEAA